MNQTSLVTVIMPAYNAENHIKDAIHSVLNQEYQNIELLIINDGSTDTTEQIINDFLDTRIRYFVQKNKGVSVARNLGLVNMEGDFFCFLDSDDLMTEQSISSRLEVFEQNVKATIIGGAQIQRNADLSKEIMIQYPSYVGPPQMELAMLNSGCFINCGTWLIKNERNKVYKFSEGWTHGEDLAFFYSISHNAYLDITQEPVQIYRRHEVTAMTNLDGLLQGYLQYISLVSKDVSMFQRCLIKAKISKIMFLSYLSSNNLVKGMLSPLKIMFS